MSRSRDEANTVVRTRPARVDDRAARVAGAQQAAHRGHRPLDRALAVGVLRDDAPRLRRCAPARRRTGRCAGSRGSRPAVPAAGSSTMRSTGPLRPGTASTAMSLHGSNASARAGQRDVPAARAHDDVAVGARDDVRVRHDDVRSGEPAGALDAEPARRAEDPHDPVGRPRDAGPAQDRAVRRGQRRRRRARRSTAADRTARAPAGSRPDGGSASLSACRICERWTSARRLRTPGVCSATAPAIHASASATTPPSTAPRTRVGGGERRRAEAAAARAARSSRAATASSPPTSSAPPSANERRPRGRVAAGQDHRAQARRRPRRRRGSRRARASRRGSRAARRASRRRPRRRR